MSRIFADPPITMDEIAEETIRPGSKPRDVHLDVAAGSGLTDEYRRLEGERRKFRKLIREVADEDRKDLLKTRLIIIEEQQDAIHNRLSSLLTLQNSRDAMKVPGEQEKLDKKLDALSQSADEDRADRVKRMRNRSLVDRLLKETGPLMEEFEPTIEELERIIIKKEPVFK